MQYKVVKLTEIAENGKSGFTGKLIKTKVIRSSRMKKLDEVLEEGKYALCQVLEQDQNTYVRDANGQQVQAVDSEGQPMTNEDGTPIWALAPTGNKVTVLNVLGQFATAAEAANELVSDEMEGLEIEEAVHVANSKVEAARAKFKFGAPISATAAVNA